MAGKNGEAVPIRIQDHNDYREEGGGLQGCRPLPCHHIVITTAPGESFSDRLTPSDPLSGYDQTNGVAIRNDLPYVALNRPAGLLIHDNFVDLVGLQVKSIHDAAVDATSTFGNNITIRNCILDGGSQDQWTVQAALATDTSSVIANSLMISHAPIGVAMKYPGFVLHSTIIVCRAVSVLRHLQSGSSMTRRWRTQQSLDLHTGLPMEGINPGRQTRRTMQRMLPPMMPGQVRGHTAKVEPQLWMFCQERATTFLQILCS